MKITFVAFVSAFMIGTISVFGQANCGAVAPSFQANIPVTVVCDGDLAQAPPLLDPGSGLPNLEYLLVNRSRNVGNSPLIIATSATPVFDLFNYPAIQAGDTVAIVPVLFDLTQIQQIVEGILNNGYAPGLSCCNLVEALLDEVCSEIRAFGISGGSDVIGLSEILNVVEVLYGDVLTIQRFTETIGTLNNQGGFLPVPCRGGTTSIPICYAVSATFVPFQAGFKVDFTSPVYINPNTQTANLSVNPIGGIPPYNITWSVDPPINLPLGLYLAYVSDALGCSTALRIEVLDSCDLLKANFNAIDISCFGKQDGLVQINISGGNPPYMLTFGQDAPQNVQAGQLITKLNLGNDLYPVTIADSRACVFQEFVYIDDAEPVQLSIRPLPDTLDLNLSTQVPFALDTVFGGNLPITVTWNFGNGTITNQPNGAESFSRGGEYEITVTARDKNNCQAIVTHRLVVLPFVSARSEANPAFRLYPQPVEAGRWITIDHPAFIYEIRLMNVMGQIIAMESISQEAQNSQLLIPHHATSGIYFLEMKGKGATLRFPLMVK